MQEPSFLDNHSVTVLLAASALVLWTVYLDFLIEYVVFLQYFVTLFSSSIDPAINISFFLASTGPVFHHWLAIGGLVDVDEAFARSLAALFDLLCCHEILMSLLPGINRAFPVGVLLLLRSSSKRLTVGGKRLTRLLLS